MPVVLNKDNDMSKKQQRKQSAKREGEIKTKHCRRELYLREEDREGKEAHMKETHR